MKYASTLTVKTAHTGRICVLTVTGDLDFLAVTEFLVHAAWAVDQQTERFVLDLAGLTFLDCAGARALAMATRFAPGGCPVIIRPLSPAARRVLDLLNLDLGRLQQEPSAGPVHRKTPARPAQAVPSGSAE